MSTHPTVVVATNLSAILDLAADLEDQAINDANDHLMPGGLAMVALGVVANLEAWAHKLDAAERRAIEEGAPMPLHEDADDWEPPLQTLLFWSEDLRRIHGYETDKRPTLASEANFVRHYLDWLWENEPHFEDFARDISTARRRLEDTLKAGDRAERIRVVCDRDYCEKPSRLILVYGDTPEQDAWKCPACKHRFDHDDMKRAHAKQLRSEGAEKFVPLVDAVGTLRAQGRGERTIRRWLAEGQVEKRRTPAGRVEVWWPDMWRLHLTVPTKTRAG